MKNLENAINDLVMSVRHNSEPTKCIDIFEMLLHEVDPKYAELAVRGMNKFMQQFKLLERSVDYTSDRSLKATLLNFHNIRDCFPEFRAALSHMLLLRDWTMAFAPDFEVVKIDVNTENLAGKLEFSEFDKRLLKHRLSLSVILKEQGIDVTDEESVEDFYESCRKVALLWNYIPTVMKAVMQTKRRKLGFDNNSKRFKV